MTVKGRVCQAGDTHSGVGVPTSVDSLSVSGVSADGLRGGAVSLRGRPHRRQVSLETDPIHPALERRTCCSSGCWTWGHARPGSVGVDAGLCSPGPSLPQVLRDGAVPGRREEEGAPAAVPSALPPVPCGECACGCSPITRWHVGPYLGAALGSHPTGCMWGPHEWRVLQPDPPGSRVPGVPFSTG